MIGDETRREVAAELRALDWAYDCGRYGDDDCEKPDEWFEEEEGE